MEILCEDVTEAQVSEMLALADLDKDGRIDYEGEFNSDFNRIHFCRKMPDKFLLIQKIPKVSLNTFFVLSQSS